MTKKELDKVIISPQIWPGKKLKVQPGNLSIFAPYGNRIYGLQSKNSINPIKNGPVFEDNGGTVYFGNDIEREDFNSFLRMINININDKNYAAFIQESSHPLEDRYFKQMRIISNFALQFMFGIEDKAEYNSLSSQNLTTEEALWAFIDSEKERFGTMFGDPRIEGKMGGDGDYAREELSFGFMLENGYSNVYRIWSKAWLVTK